MFGTGSYFMNNSHIVFENQLLIGSVRFDSRFLPYGTGSTVSRSVVIEIGTNYYVSMLISIFYQV